jgi:hypothetical protein
MLKKVDWRTVIVTLVIVVILLPMMAKVIRKAT